MESEHGDRSEYGGGYVTKITVYDENNNVKATFTRVISALLIRSLSGECSFEFTVTSAMAADLNVGLAVTLESDDIYYLFRTARVSKSISGGITICKIACEHISYQLNDPEFDIEKFEFKGSVSECLSELLKGTPLVAGECDPPAPIELKINQKCTRRAALMQIVGLCLGEIDYSGNSVIIRSHLGFEEFREIMDGKNITDLTVDMDSRSNTFNYGLKLYKKLDFAVGDNVHIVFSPFYLDVKTRIISMSMNPFNRSEISIEVGDYVPSISDNLYKLEREANKTRTDVSDSTASIKTAVNNSELYIENKVTEIFRLSFNAIKATYAAFTSTVNFTVTKAGTIEFIVKKNENEVMRYTEQFNVQDYARAYSYPFVSEDGVNVLTLSAVSPDGAAVLPRMRTWGYVMGAYLAGDNPWDGYIRIRETLSEFTHRRKWRKKHEKIRDTLIFVLPEMLKPSAEEKISEFTKRIDWRKKHEEMTASTPFAWSPIITSPPPLKAENISDTEVNIEMRNPVTTDGIVTPNAFSMLITTGTETVEIKAVSVMLDSMSEFSDGSFGSVIHLTFDTDIMKDSTQSITVLYNSDVGNLRDALNDVPCDNFQTSFIYVPKEE